MTAITGTSRQAFFSQHKNLLDNAAPTASSTKQVDVDKVTYLDEVQRIGKSTGKIVLSGTYAGDNTRVVEFMIPSGSGAERRITSQRIGVGNGSISSLTVDNTVSVQTIRLRLASLGVDSERASALFGGIPIEARDDYFGDKGNFIRIEVDTTALVLTPFQSAPTDANRGDSAFAASGWDFGAKTLTSSGQLAPDASVTRPNGTLRIAFDEYASKIYRQYKDGNPPVVNITPPLEEDVSAGQTVYKVENQYTVSVIYDNPADLPLIQEDYQGVTLFDILTQLLGSKLVQPSIQLLFNRRPDGIAGLDVDLRTEGFVRKNSGEGSRYATGFENIVITDQDRSEILTAECYANSAAIHPDASPGNELFKFSSSVNGVLLNRVVSGDTIQVSDDGSGGTVAAVIDPADPTGPEERIRFLLPKKYSDAFDAGATQEAIRITEIDYAQREQDVENGVYEYEPEITLHEDYTLLGARPRPQQLTLVWSLIPRGDCGNPEITGNPDPACIGLTGDLPGLPGDVAATRTPPINAQIAALQAAGVRDIHTVNFDSGVEEFGLGPSASWNQIINQSSDTAVKSTFESARLGAVPGFTATPTVGYAYGRQDSGDTQYFSSYAAAQAAREADTQAATPIVTFNRTIAYTWPSGSSVTLTIDYTPRLSGTSASGGYQQVTDLYSGTWPGATIRTNTAGAGSEVFYRLEDATTFRDEYIGTGGNASIVSSTEPDPNDPDYQGAIRAAQEMLNLLGLVYESPAAIAQFDLTWATMSSDIDDVLAQIADGSYPIFYNQFVADFNTIRALANVAEPDEDEPCYTDTGAIFGFRVTGSFRKYKPLFPNVIFNSTDENGFRTDEFRITLRIPCTQHLKLGDTVIIDVAGFGAASAYQVDDQLILDLRGARPLDMEGGIDGDGQHTWVVESEDATSRPPYIVTDGAEQDYQALVGAGPAAGVNFLITRGSIPNELNDVFALSVEGGQYQVQIDGGGYSAAADIPAAIFNLFDNVDAQFVDGPGTSFEDGDYHKFTIEQPHSSSNALRANSKAWRMASGAQSLVAVFSGGAQDISYIAIPWHNIPQGRVFSLKLLRPNLSLAYDSGPLTWREHGIIHSLGGVVSDADRLQFEIDDGADVEIFWLWAGQPIIPSKSALSPIPRLSRATATPDGINIAPLHLGRGYGLSLSYGGETGFPNGNDMAELDALMLSVSESGEPLCAMPNTLRPEAYMVLWAGDNFERADAARFHPPNDELLKLSFDIELSPIYNG